MKDGQQDEGQDDRHGQGAQAAKTAGEEEKHLDRLLRHWLTHGAGWRRAKQPACPARWAIALPAPCEPKPVGHACLGGKPISAVTLIAPGRPAAVAVAGTRAVESAA
jgi:hypothetical protein